jgi:hypothetical protein
MGDLLLAAADIIPLGKTLPKTLKRWGRQLAGTDLHPEFIEGTKARLVLLARQRHGNDAPSVESYKELFPNIRIGNGLGRCAQYRLATHLLLNPPFGLVNAPANCKWAGGRVSEAALFVTTALERATPGTEILAILPDVLRSGSFTERWRNRVEELSHVHMVEPYGIFDESADVDVFLLRLIRRKGADDTDVEPWRAGVQQAKTTIADFFDVHVGRVVPHRDEQVGPRRSYIHPRCVPTWTVMKNFSETRKHSGLVYKPPFTVIRRTSRPGHPYRATATVIGGKKPLVVENHLIVCEPFDRKLATCKKLMQHLKSEAVNKYLDARIRCRHLTVDSVRTIPFEQ